MDTIADGYSAVMWWTGSLSKGDVVCQGSFRLRYGRTLEPLEHRTGGGIKFRGGRELLP